MWDTWVMPASKKKTRDNTKGAHPVSVYTAAHDALDEWAARNAWAPSKVRAVSALAMTLSEIDDQSFAGLILNAVTPADRKMLAIAILRRIAGEELSSPETETGLNDAIEIGETLSGGASLRKSP